MNVFSLVVALVAAALSPLGHTLSATTAGVLAAPATAAYAAPTPKPLPTLAPLDTILPHP